MTLLNRLERILGPFAIPGLIRYVAAFNALIFILSLASPGYTAMLSLNSDAILHGQVWRLITWIFIPRASNVLFMFFYLSFLWWIGDALEEAWGTFRLNLYYFLGMIGCTVAAFLFGRSPGNLILNTSLLFAAATIAPDFEISLYGILPLKMKWVAIIALIYPLGFMFLFGGIAAQLTILICLVNYFLFFGPTVVRNAAERRATMKRRAKFEAAKDNSATLHCCSVCGITEVSNPHADFRVSSDDREYCTAHLPQKK